MNVCSSKKKQNGRTREENPISGEVTATIVAPEAGTPETETSEIKNSENVAIGKKEENKEISESKEEEKKGFGGDNKDKGGDKPKTKKAHRIGCLSI
ncbi:hypothetical protein L5515_001926 [Caenorhabditis briggsae]|nr:hypothetical protein L5515_001926 [Caenorhabditis briggsae]